MTCLLWHICHDKRCIQAAVRLGPSWEFQWLGCTVPPWISHLFCHCRTLSSVITFASLRYLMPWKQSSSSHLLHEGKNVLSYNEWSFINLFPCWMLHYFVQKLFFCIFVFFLLWFENWATSMSQSIMSLGESNVILWLEGRPSET